LILLRSALKKHLLSPEIYTSAILSGNRTLLAQAITLTESRLPEHQALAQDILHVLLPHTGKAWRIGITGVPGVGKSTFIEALGRFLTEEKQQKVAVLAIDPSSQTSRGSILGDKTRMEILSQHPLAFIRPSPASGTLGGIARKTREALLLCEAAGFEVILVETVGVGQSETTVKEMTDFFVLLLLAGAGDELQGIKRGIMELADLLVITKTDSENIAKAQLARMAYQNALHLFPPAGNGWQPQVLTCSALQNTGIKEVWEQVENFAARMQQNGFREENRRRQNLDWFYQTLKAELENRFFQNQNIKNQLPAIEKLVQEGKISPVEAAFLMMSLP
jgi:LAO/AO transport system kinase